MKPLPWSYSALDDFKNCPRAYYEKKVAKSVKEEPSAEKDWGERVHKCFELRQRDGVGKDGKPVSPLPTELAEHEGYMTRLEAMPGYYFATEQRIGFTKKGLPCGWETQDIWCRGIIDYQRVDMDERIATLIDYKTGKPHTKFEQLALFAIHTFMMFPVDVVRARFYWTKTLTETEQVWGRTDIPMLWGKFIPHLTQYREAFKEDIWQPRPSGLCNGWCPVKDCEHWKPKREKRR